MNKGEVCVGLSPLPVEKYTAESNLASESGNSKIIEELSTISSMTTVALSAELPDISNSSEEPTKCVKRVGRTLGPIFLLIYNLITVFILITD